MSAPCIAHGLDTVFLAAPTSTERRLKLVAQYSTGFVYLVSRTGVTGERDSLSDAVAPLVRSHARGDRSAAGGGIRHLASPSTWRNWARQVEAVVVGSAIVRADRAQRGQRLARDSAGIVRPRIESTDLERTA